MFFNTVDPCCSPDLVSGVPCRFRDRPSDPDLVSGALVVFVCPCLLKLLINQFFWGGFLQRRLLSSVQNRQISILRLLRRGSGPSFPFALPSLIEMAHFSFAQLKEDLKEIAHGHLPHHGAKAPKFADNYDAAGKDLGSGAFSVVKLCTHRASGKQYAVKCCAKGKLKKEDLDGLYKETQLLREMDHPHIIKCYETFDEGSTFYIVTELVSGGDLFDRIIHKTTYTEKEGTVHVARGVLKPVVGPLPPRPPMWRYAVLGLWLSALLTLYPPHPPPRHVSHPRPPPLIQSTGLASDFFPNDGVHARHPARGAPGLEAGEHPLDLQGTHGVCFFGGLWLCNPHLHLHPCLRLGRRTTPTSRWRTLGLRRGSAT